MKLLIFSASTGGGHKRAAAALEDTIHRLNPEVEVTVVDGTVYLVGSKAYPPKFTWQNEMSGISSSEIAFTIECSSSHGLYICI